VGWHASRAQLRSEPAARRPLDPLLELALCHEERVDHQPAQLVVIVDTSVLATVMLRCQTG